MARFNAPPGWDQPPAGFTPPSNWQPSSHWPQAPANWHFWVDDNGNPTAPPPGAWNGGAGSQSSTPAVSQPSAAPSTQTFGTSANNFDVNQQSNQAPVNNQGPMNQGPVNNQFGGSQPQQGVYSAQPGDGQPAPKKKGKGLLIGLIAGLLALLLVIGAIVFFLMNSEPTLSNSDIDKAYSNGLKLGNHTFNKESSSSEKGGGTDKDSGTCGLSTKKFAEKADYSVNGKENTTNSKSMASAMTVHFTDTNAAKKAFDEYTKKLDGCNSDGVSIKLNKKNTGAHPAWSTFTATSQGIPINVGMFQWGNTLTLNMALDGVDGETVAKDVKDQLKKN